MSIRLILFCVIFMSGSLSWANEPKIEESVAEWMKTAPDFEVMNLRESLKIGREKFSFPASDFHFWEGQLSMNSVNAHLDLALATWTSLAGCKLFVEVDAQGKYKSAIGICE